MGERKRNWRAPALFSGARIIDGVEMIDKVRPIWFSSQGRKDSRPMHFSCIFFCVELVGEDSETDVSDCNPRKLACRKLRRSTIVSRVC